MNQPARLGVLLLLCTGSGLRAQEPATLSAGDRERIDSSFSRFATPGSPGCALGVMRDGRLAYAKGYGLASLELGVPITASTVFDIGSVSKQFTALAVALLAQDGKLSLDDEIQKYVPEIPRYGKPVTLRHLLHHTSGLRDYIDLLFWSGVQEESVTGDREALAVLSRQHAPNFDAGAEYLYSNTGFFLLSVIVKRVSGESLRRFAAERIFGPLGMQHTFYLDDHGEPVPGKASSYAPHGAKRFALALANWEQTGDGGVQTSIEDLLLWERNFSDARIGGRALLDGLELQGLLNDGTRISYALGQVVDRYHGLRRVSHGGSWAGFRANFTRFPEQHTSIGVLCNVANAAPASLANRVADVLLTVAFSAPAESPPPPQVPHETPVTVHPLGDYVGRYRSDELLADWEISRAGDSLRLAVGPLLETRLLPTPNGALIAVGKLQFVEIDGRIAGITLTSRGARNFRLTRITQ